MSYVVMFLTLCAVFSLSLFICGIWWLALIAAMICAATTYFLMLLAEGNSGRELGGE